jgi:hypothetical protein
MDRWWLREHFNGTALQGHQNGIKAIYLIRANNIYKKTKHI